MQAHPQSSSAARAPTPNVPPAPHTAGPTVPPTARENACLVADSAGLAHDAGNLLGGLRLYADLLERPGVLAPEHRHYSCELRGLADRSTSLIARLLAHIDAGAGSEATVALSRHAAPLPSDPAASLQELAPLLRRMVEPGATIDLQSPLVLPDGAFAPPALTPEILERIVVNLVCNAARALTASRRPGLIGIVLRPASTGLCLQIRDNGPGLAPAAAQAFLAPSLVSARTQRGLGHRIVHELTQTSGGVLRVDTVAGLGTLFTLEWTLPAAVEASVVRPPASVHLPPSAGRQRFIRSGARSTTAPSQGQEDSVHAC